ncbi:MAG: class I SAM-dependent methyltransferase [Acidobacteria bacterium]|nr:class I SAM-dependent methyltransferase [Acidobacteriota bacterium]
MEDLFRLFEELPRQGPGSFSATKRALEAAKPLLKNPVVLDIGCGTGKQTTDLASLLPGARIIGTDVYPGFLQKLRNWSAENPEAAEIKPVAMSMFDPSVKPGSIDMIWSEGAIYIMGFSEGLQKWRSFLKPGGFLVVSEVTWLKDDIPDEIEQFWMKYYPAIKDIQGNIDAAVQEGFETVENFTLEREAWWEDYYSPIESSFSELEKLFKDSKIASEELKTLKTEMEMHRKYGDCYSYQFYILRKD